MRLLFLLVSAFTLLPCGTPAAAPSGEWTFPDAPLRFTLNLTRGPSHREAGYIACIPDGGILPSPRPGTRVVADDGTLLDSYTLWHGRKTGLWIVFAAPASRKQEVTVYVDRTGGAGIWSPQTGLRPGPLLVTDSSQASLTTAGKLSGMGAVGDSVRVQIKAGIREAPLSVGGDDSGRPRPSSFYLQTYVVTADPGRIWIAPFFNEGANRVQVNGLTLTPSKQFDQWGGTGQWMDLDEGLHRVEFFSASENEGAYDRSFKGHAFLAWRTPNMPPQELGTRNRSKDAKPYWAARVVRDNEVVRSGETSLIRAEAKNGGPVAVVDMKAGRNFWFGNEGQLGLFTFSALTAGSPENTTWTWTVEPPGVSTGSTITWLVPGLTGQRVTLTASSALGSSSCTASFFAYPTEGANLNREQDRRDFRLAMQTMLQAYPARPDPCARWSDAHWNNLIRTAEYGKGYYLLDELLGEHFATARQKLAPDDLRRLMRIYLDTAGMVDPEKALTRAAQFRDAVADGIWRAQLDVIRAEILAIRLSRTDEADRLLSRLIREGGGYAANARIRLGDLMLANGDLNGAAAQYADVQKQVRHERRGPKTPGERPVEGWKVGAVKDASYSKQITSLLEEDRLDEARTALDEWERDFPLAKIGEDFILLEARLYMKLDDFQRARWLLEPYCRLIDASNFLPDAAIALLRCMEETNASPESLRDTAALLKERLQYHPVAAAFDRYLDTGGKP